MTISEPIQALIWQCINHYDFENAIFLSERLHSEVSSEDSLFNISTCYYRTGQIEAVKYILSKELHLTARLKFLLAKCYFETQDYNKAETVLVGRNFLESSISKDWNFIYGDTTPFVLQILAKIYIKTERENLAKDILEKVVKYNPCLWISFKSLCDMDCHLDPNEVFTKCDVNNIIKNLTESATEAPHKPYTLFDQTNKIPLEVKCLPSSASPAKVFGTPPRTAKLLATPTRATPTRATPSPDLTPPYTRRQMRSKTALNFGQYVTVPLEGPRTSGPHCHPLFAGALSSAPINALQPNAAAANAAAVSPAYVTPECPRCPNALLNMPSLSLSCASTTPRFGVMETPKQPSSPPRKSASAMNSVKENKKKRTNPVRISQNFLPKKKMKSALANTSSDLIYSMQMNSLDGLFTLLHQLSTAYVYVSRYDCGKAIASLTSLPDAHLTSSFVQTLIGRVLFENMKYKEAKYTYEGLLSSAPYYIHCCDYYSTTLWHLNCESDLSTLAQRCVKSNRRCPETWCAMGNCFSLQKRHLLAIQYFKRALLVIY